MPCVWTLWFCLSSYSVTYICTSGWGNCFSLYTATSPHTHSRTHLLFIYLFILFPPMSHLLTEGGSSWVENGSMSVSSHVQTEVACGQPHFMNANKKGDQKSYQNTTDIWQLLVSGSLFISAPGILKINGFCTDAICCQDWCFSPWNKVLLVL